MLSNAILSFEVQQKNFPCVTFFFLIVFYNMEKHIYPLLKNPYWLARSCVVWCVLLYYACHSISFPCILCIYMCVLELDCDFDCAQFALLQLFWPHPNWLNGLNWCFVVCLFPKVQLGWTLKQEAVVHGETSQRCTFLREVNQTPI